MIIRGLFANNLNGIKLDESALKMPITYNGKPIGFIDSFEGENNEVVIASFWDKDMELQFCEDGVCSLELNAESVYEN